MSDIEKNLLDAFQIDSHLYQPTCRKRIGKGGRGDYVFDQTLLTTDYSLYLKEATGISVI